MDNTKNRDEGVCLLLLADVVYIQNCTWHVCSNTFNLSSEIIADCCSVQYIVWVTILKRMSSSWFSISEDILGNLLVTWFSVSFFFFGFSVLGQVPLMTAPSAPVLRLLLQLPVPLPVQWNRPSTITGTTTNPTKSQVNDQMKYNQNWKENNK